jgi:hypothetical protein
MMHDVFSPWVFPPLPFYAFDLIMQQDEGRPTN